jgi:DNA-binding XRE family transcriptional regulator
MQPEELRTLRRQIGASQAELGDAIGLSRVTIGLMERGDAPIEKRTELAVRYVAEHADMVFQTEDGKSVVVEVKGRPAKVKPDDQG